MLKNAALNSVDRALMAAARLLSAVLIARVLGPDGYGVFQFALTASIIAATLADLGFGIANNFLASHYPHVRPRLFANAMTFVSVTGTITAIGTSVVIYILRPHRFPELPESYLWWIPLSIPIQALQISLIGLTYGADRFKDKVVGTCLHYIIFLAAIVLFASLDHLSINILMPLWIVGLSISSLYWTGVLWKDFLSAPKWDRAVLKEQLSYGRKSYPYNAAHMLNFRLDMFLVAYFLKAEYVGWYALATSITEALLYLPKALSNVVLTEIAMQLRNGIQSNYHLIYKGIILVIGVAIILTAILAPFLIPAVFSASFTPAITPLLLLLPGTLAMALGIIAAYHLFGLGKPFQPSLAALIGAVITVALDLLLIPLLDINGAALASTIAYITFCGVCLRSIIAECKTRLRALFIPTRADIAKLLGIVKQLWCHEYLSKRRGAYK